MNRDEDEVVYKDVWDYVKRAILPKFQFFKSFAGIAIGGVIVLLVLSGSIYTVDEGNVGIIKRFGEAVDSTDPGIHLKLPIIDTVTPMEVRTRKYQLTMSVATTGKNEHDEVELQMPSQVVISANWNIPKSAALEIYRQYGGLEQYEDRILDPRVIKTAKTVMSQHRIEFIVSNRQTVTDQIASALTEALAGNLVTMTDVNLEDIDFPNSIKKAIEEKQKAKLAAETESYNLQQKDLESQRLIKVAQSEAESIKVKSIEESAAIERKGKAEASAISDKARALAENPKIIELTKAERWDGVMPTTMAGGDTSFLMDIRGK